MRCSPNRCTRYCAELRVNGRLPRGPLTSRDFVWADVSRDTGQEAGVSPLQLLSRSAGCGRSFILPRGLRRTRPRPSSQVGLVQCTFLDVLCDCIGPSLWSFLIIFSFLIHQSCTAYVLHTSVCGVNVLKVLNVKSVDLFIG